jgi:oxygen-independent coproporphyrinogen-3 oxidase
MNVGAQSLYIHLPWCIRKCPYCDFNSHALHRSHLPEQEYVDALIRDLRFETARGTLRPVASIYFGGGTPSLFSGAALGRVLEAVDRELGIDPRAEITIEANPGTTEAQRFRDYRAVGINRLSLGVQSLNDPHLSALGRIHDAAQARAAVHAAQSAGFENLNIDLMYGLPGQTPGQALTDLRGVVALGPPHVSWYQLTIEPNTEFHHARPALPADDEIWRMHEEGLEFLCSAGYSQYEVSAHARGGFRCRHNLNYWEFGDYLGLGAGAHGKLSDIGAKQVRRDARHRLPERYLSLAGAPDVVVSTRMLTQADLVLEFMLNAGRLKEGFRFALFEERTGLAIHELQTGLEAGVARGLLESDATFARPTPLGRRFLNDLLLCFMPEDGEARRRAGA